MFTLTTLGWGWLDFWIVKGALLRQSSLEAEAVSCERKKAITIRLYSLSSVQN